MKDDAIEWSDDALERLKKAPIFVRHLAKAAVEKTARQQNVTRITAEFMEQVKKQQMGG